MSHRGVMTPLWLFFLPEGRHAMDEAPVSEETPTTTEAPTYQQQSWAGVPHYACLRCAYSTFLLALLQDHMTERHDGVMRCAAAIPVAPASLLASTESSIQDTPIPPDVPEAPQPPVLPDDAPDARARDENAPVETPASAKEDAEPCPPTP
jgi:hypothetical protein